MTKEKQIKNIEKKVYDKRASSYDNSIWARWIHSWVENFSSDIPRKCSIIDIGCGTGNVLYELTKKDPYLLAGIDMSPKSIAIAKNKLKNSKAELKVGDAENKLPWGDKTFDIAVLTATIHHFPNPKKVLDEVFRVLKSEGRIIIADPYFFFPLRQIINLILRIYPINGDLHFFSQRELRDLMKKCGFQKIKQKYAGFSAWYLIGFKH